MHRLMLVAALSTGSMASTIAIAQVNQVGAPPPAAGAQAPNDNQGTTPAPLPAPNAGAAPEAGGIADIIVTAQRRAENVQKSSLAIQVLTADSLVKAGVTGPTDLSTLVSGVNVAQAGPVTQTFVRGVGSFATNSYAEGAIAYNIDGFYIARPTSVYGNFYDLERIEVLKGPQGTLYGRNATGGAINLVTNKPKLGEIGGSVDLEAGNYNLIRSTGAMNLPFGDKVAVRASYQVVNRDGYLSDGYDDEKSEAVRLQLLAKPTDRLTILLAGSYAHLGGQGPGTVRVPNLSGHQWTGGSDSSGLGQPGSTCIFDPVQGATGCGELQRLAQDGFVNDRNYSATAQVDWDLGFATLTVMPGYRHVNNTYRTYVPGFLFDSHETSDEKSLETRLGHDGSRLKWVIGNYLYREDQTQIFYVNQGVNQTGADTPKLDTKSWAVFGQATYSLTDRLRLIGGIRYTYEHRDQAGTESITAGPPTFLAQYPYITLPISGAITTRKVTFKAGAEYDLTPHNMVFATVATGTKAGGVINALVNNTYPPEKLTAYEVGSRNRFFDNTLQVNLEGFYWRYRNKQEGGIRYTPEDGVAFLITPGNARLYGADLDIVWQPTPRDTFSVGGEYLNAKYTSFTFEGFVASYDPGRTSCRLDYADVNAAGGLPVDCSGKPLPKAPKWSGSARYDHRFDFAAGSKLDVGAALQFSSRYWLNTDYIPVEHAPSYATIDSDVTWTDPSGHLQIGLWGRNLTKKAVYTGGIQEPFKDGVFYTSIRPPRTFGGRIGLKY